MTNITEKITGSDGDFFVDKMKTFVGEQAAASKRWLAVLMLHYIHLPHPAMPTYYAERADSRDPDYVGTLQQLDDTIGELVEVLQDASSFNDTLIFYTSGPNTASTALTPTQKSVAPCRTLATGTDSLMCCLQTTEPTASSRPKRCTAVG